MNLIIKNLIQEVDPNLKRLGSYLFPYKWKIVSSVIFMIGAGLGSSLIAKLLGALTDVGFYNKETWIIVTAPICLILISILNGGSMFMSNYILGKVSQDVLKTLRGQIFHRILRWPSSAYIANPTGIVSSKFVYEANFALSSATKSFIILIRDSFQVIALTLMLIWHNAFLSLICLFVGPLVFWLLRFISRRLKTAMNSSQMSFATLLVKVREIYEAQKIIKIYGTYKEEIDKFYLLNQEIKKVVLRITRISSLGTPLTQTIYMIGVAIVLSVALVQSQLGILTLGDFVTFLAAMLLIMPPLRHLAGLNSSLVMIKVAAVSIFQTLDQPVEEDKGSLLLSNCRGEVVFDHVFLRYPNSQSFSVNDFTLQVPAGTKIALVGLSGSGKTSLINMIPRFWNPTKGQILIDNINIKNIKLKSLRDQISIVSQDIILFDDTIRANIEYGSKNNSEENIKKAIVAADLKDFIESLPKGLDTQIGEAGDRLSGGQKQRIAIARAILKNAPILILDEATSALDSISENQIKRSLSILMSGKTTFMVAHRLSSIPKDSLIVVLEKGSIVETGTWKELIEKRGVFSHLCKLQGIEALEV